MEINSEAGVVDLHKMAYKNEVTSAKSNKGLMEIMDDIVQYLVEDNKLLIHDIEHGKKPIRLVDNRVRDYISGNKISLKDEDGKPMDFDRVMDIVNSYLWGYGPIQPFIIDDDISDIFIFNKDSIMIKEFGVLRSTNIKFPTNKALYNFASGLALRNGGGLSELNAIQLVSDAKSQATARLRIDIAGYPVTSGPPHLVIRKIPKIKKNFDELIEEGMMNLEMKKYFIEATIAGLNIIWTGRGGSGKSTCMNTCLDYVPETEVQLIMQESEELFTKHKATFMQRVKKKQGENDIAYTLKDETINGLLMSLDRMIIGEIKDAEAMEFFNAIDSGHIGWTSVHSPSAEECLNKIVQLMKYSNTDLPKSDLMEMLTQIDVIVYMQGYKCCQIYEISGFNEKSKKPEFNPMFLYETEKIGPGKYRGNFKRVGNSCEKIMKKVRTAIIDKKLNEDELISVIDV